MKLSSVQDQIKTYRDHPMNVYHLPNRGKHMINAMQSVTRSKFSAHTLETQFKDQLEEGPAFLGLFSIANGFRKSAIFLFVSGTGNISSHNETTNKNSNVNCRQVMEAMDTMYQDGSNLPIVSVNVTKLSLV